jgi:signal-transduction protein with cAMP-binding, CBS, and nucleotidyltransferase domain
MTYFYREVIHKVSFLANASESLIKILVRLLKPQVFAPGEYIIRFGDIGKEMYFINKGVVMVCSDDGKIFNVLTDGSFFGGKFLASSSLI